MSNNSEMPKEAHSAFPLCVPVNFQYAEPGMTLRDYFATNCGDRPIEELVDAAGLIFSANKVWYPSDGQTPAYESFDKWWLHLTRDERLKIRAKARFDHADAMISARGGLS